MSDRVGKSGDTPKMEDVPLDGALASGNSIEGDSIPTISKSSSLKRFFKFNSRKSTSAVIEASSSGSQKDDQMKASKSDEEINKRGSLDAKNAKRFHLRLGGMHKYASRGNMEKRNSLEQGNVSLEKADSSEMPLNPQSSSSDPSAAAAGVSKPSLKGSISTYMKSFFKRSASATSPGASTLVTTANDTDDPQAITIDSYINELPDVPNTASGSSNSIDINKVQSDLTPKQSEKNADVKMDIPQNESNSIIETQTTDTAKAKEVDEDTEDDGISELEREIKLREDEIHALKLSNE